MKQYTPVTRQQELETHVAIGAFLLLLSLLFQQRWYGIASLAVLAVVLFFRPLARHITRLWLGFAQFAGSCNTKLILTLLFFLVLTPTALLYRLIKRNPLQLKRSTDSGTYFDTHDRQYSRADLEKMW